MTSITLCMKGLEGNKQLTMNTNALESKINAVEVIRELIKNLEKSYFPFVEQTWAVISQLFDYKYSKAVRQAVWQSCEYIIESCPNEETMVVCYQNIYPLFKNRITESLKKNDHEEVTNLLNTLLHCTEDFKRPGFLPMPEIEALFNSLSQAAWLCEIQKDQRKQEFEQNKETHDEED